MSKEVSVSRVWYEGSSVRSAVIRGIVTDVTVTEVLILKRNFRSTTWSDELTRPTLNCALLENKNDRFGPSSLRLILPKGRGSYKASVSSRKKSGDQITSFGAHTVQALVIQKGFAESIALFLRSAMLTLTQWHSWKLPSTTTVWSAGHWAAPLEHLWIKGLAKAKY